MVGDFDLCHIVYNALYVKSLLMSVKRLLFQLAAQVLASESLPHVHLEHKNILQQLEWWVYRPDSTSTE